MSDTEAQLAHLRSNAKIAITHHTRTMKSTLAQERTTAAELEELINEYNTRRDNLEEAHNQLMLMIPDEDLEQEAQQHGAFLALQNRIRYKADNKLMALGGSKSPSGATSSTGQQIAQDKHVRPHPGLYTPPTPARRTSAAPTRHSDSTPTSTIGKPSNTMATRLFSGHPPLSTSGNSANRCKVEIYLQPALVSNQDAMALDTNIHGNSVIEVVPQLSDQPSGLQDSQPEQSTFQLSPSDLYSSPRSTSNQRPSASLDAVQQIAVTPIQRHTPRSSVANRLFNTEVTPQQFSKAIRKSAGVSPQNSRDSSTPTAVCHQRISIEAVLQMSSDYQSALQYTSVCSTPSEFYPLQDTLPGYPLCQLSPSEPRLDSLTASESCSQDTLPEYLLSQLSQSELRSDSSTSLEPYPLQDTLPDYPLCQLTPSEPRLESSTSLESCSFQDTLPEYLLCQVSPSELRLDSSTSSESCSSQDTLPEYLLCQLSPSELQSDSSNSSESYIFQDTPTEDPLLHYTPAEFGSDRSIPSESRLLQDTLPGYQYQHTLPGYHKVQDTSSEYQKTTQPRYQLMEYDPTRYKVQPVPSGHKHLTQQGCYLLQNSPSYQVQPAPLEYQEQVALLAYQPALSASPGLQMKSSQQGYQGQPESSGFQQALPAPAGFLMQPDQPGYIPGLNVPSEHTQGSLQKSQGQNSFNRVQGSGDNHNQDAT